jgi:uncharacterized membrane protein
MESWFSLRAGWRAHPLTVHIAVVCTLLIGLLLRLPRMVALPIWSDEYHTIRLMRLPLADLLQGRYEELNPPLYFALMHLYTRVLGESEIVLRSFSVLMSLTTLLLLWLVARELLRDDWGALVALMVAALNPFFVYYASEIRSYALLSTLGLGTLYLYLRLRRAEAGLRLWAGALALGIAASAYTHHFGLMIVLMVAIFIVVDAFGKRWAVTHSLACAAVALGLLLYVPGLLLLYRQYRSYPPLDEASRIPLLDSYRVFVLSFHQPRYERVLELFAIVLLALGLCRMVAQPRTRRDGIAITLVLLGGMGLIALAYSIEINIIRRYLLPIAALACVPFGMLVRHPAAQAGARRARYLPAVFPLIAACFLVGYTAYSFDVVRRVPDETATLAWRSDLRDLSKQILRERLKGEPIVLTAWDLSPLQYYLDEPMRFGLDSLDDDTTSVLVITSTFTPADSRLDTAVLLYKDRVEGLTIVRVTR